MSSKLVLVLNCGSSSLKFAILDAVNGDEYLSGLAECFHPVSYTHLTLPTNSRV
mgnify:CR=1 FL=1